MASVPASSKRKAQSRPSKPHPGSMHCRSHLSPEMVAKASKGEQARGLVEEGREDAFGAQGLRFGVWVAGSGLGKEL
jgi:hypothetical protein